MVVEGREIKGMKGKPANLMLVDPGFSELTQDQVFRSEGRPGFRYEGCASTYAVTRGRSFLFRHRTIHSGGPVRVAWSE
jgi:hypothetical protein